MLEIVTIDEEHKLWLLSVLDCNRWGFVVLPATALCLRIIVEQAATHFAPIVHLVGFVCI